MILKVSEEARDVMQVQDLRMVPDRVQGLFAEARNVHPWKQRQPQRRRRRHQQLQHPLFLHSRRRQTSGLKGVFVQKFSETHAH